jgi:hypothetical protein
VAREFGNWTAADLELGSTIIYTDRELSAQPNKVTLETLVRKVREVKPHFLEGYVLGKVRDLQSKGYLNSLVTSTAGSSSSAKS